METTETARHSLAVYGGSPVRKSGRAWPKWPYPAPGAEANLLSVIRGDRWTLSGPATRSRLFERHFADMFARYVGTRYCVPVDHGSSALVVALESLGLEPCARVLVPTLTWVASASAVLRAGLVPVLVDVGAETGCLSASNLDLAVDAQAVVAVHWSCAMADIPAIMAVTGPRHMVVVEDCAQAHGARWRGQSAGSLGRLGCFSMQQGKVLSSGEGGAVVTDDPTLAPVLEELRADSRRYRRGRAGLGESDLLETASTMGANFCMSEFQAAVLCAQLLVLDSQHDIRAANYAVLQDLVGDIPGVRLLRPPAEQERMAIYELPFIFDSLPNGMDNRQLAAALSAELGVPFYLTDTPLHRSRLLRPWAKSTMAPLAREFAALNSGRHFTNADFFADHTVVTHHSALLGDERDMTDIAAAITKITRLCGLG